MAKRSYAPLPWRPWLWIWIVDRSGNVGHPEVPSYLESNIQNWLFKLRDNCPKFRPSYIILECGDDGGISLPRTWIKEPFSWFCSSPRGQANFGLALKLAANLLTARPMTMHEVAPVLVWVTYSRPADDWRTGRETIQRLRWGLRTVRFCVKIGNDVSVEALSSVASHEDSIFSGFDVDQLITFASSPYRSETTRGDE
jgi:hypothetical protein